MHVNSANTWKRPNVSAISTTRTYFWRRGQVMRNIKQRLSKVFFEGRDNKTP